MSDSTEPSWIAAGAEAAVRSDGTSHTIEYVRIDRVTNTTVVLIDGRRYRRAGYRKQLGEVHGVGSQLVDPADPGIVRQYARQLLRAFAREATSTTDGSAATVGTMDLEQVRAEFNRLTDMIGASRREIDRRAGL